MLLRVNLAHMARGGLETLAEYGKALGIEPTKADIREVAFLIYSQRESGGMPGTQESDWYSAERAWYANQWVTSITPATQGRGYKPTPIEQQVSTLAHAIREKRSGKFGQDSPENWELAAQMIGQRTLEGNIIVVNRNLPFLLN